MADVTISDLPLKTELLDSDMVVVDSGTQSHRMYYAQFKTLFLQALQEYFVDAAGDTMTGDLSVEGDLSVTGAASAATPATGANNTQLATTAWIRATMSQNGGALASYTKSGNGYIKFNNGIIIQWGLSPTVGFSQSTVVTLPTPFTSSNFRVTASAYLDPGAPGDKGDYYWINAYTTTSFTLNSKYEWGTCQVAWMAIGY